MMIPPQAQQQAPSPQYQQQPVSQLVFPPQNQALSQQHPNGAQMNNQHAAPQGQYQQYPMPPQQQQQQVLAPLQQQPMQLYNQNQTIVPPQAPRPPMPVPPQGIQFPGGQSQAQAGMPAAPNPLPLVAPPAGAQQAAPAMPHLQFQPNGQ
jgi:hypothetical protein